MTVVQGNFRPKRRVRQLKGAALYEAKASATNLVALDAYDQAEDEQNIREQWWLSDVLEAADRYRSQRERIDYLKGYRAPLMRQAYLLDLVIAYMEKSLPEPA